MSDVRSEADEPMPGWATQVQYRALAERLRSADAEVERLREAIRAMSSEVDPIKRNQIASGALDLESGCASA